MNLSPDVYAGHELNPRLWHLGDEVFKDDCQSNVWDKIYWASRRDIISNVDCLDMVFCEVNHRTSVFLPAMKRLFPKAKYILLWRDFDETVISGCRWGWYSKLDRNIIGRIYPNGQVKDVRLACAWYWVELYKYLLRHLIHCNYINFPFTWIKQHDYLSIQNAFKVLKIGVPERRLIDDVLMQKHNAAKNLQEVPKIWQEYDQQAQEIQRILTSQVVNR